MFAISSRFVMVLLPGLDGCCWLSPPTSSSEWKRPQTIVWPTIVNGPEHRCRTVLLFFLILCLHHQHSNGTVTAATVISKLLWRELTKSGKTWSSIRGSQFPHKMTLQLHTEASTHFGFTSKQTLVIQKRLLIGYRSSVNQLSTFYFILSFVWILK